MTVIFAKIKLTLWHLPNVKVAFDRLSHVLERDREKQRERGRERERKREKEREREKQREREAAIPCLPTQLMHSA